LEKTVLKVKKTVLKVEKNKKLDLNKSSKEIIFKICLT